MLQMCIGAIAFAFLADPQVLDLEMLGDTLLVTLAVEQAEDPVWSVVEIDTPSDSIAPLVMSRSARLSVVDGSSLNPLIVNVTPHESSVVRTFFVEGDTAIDFDALLSKHEPVVRGPWEATAIGAYGGGRFLLYYLEAPEGGGTHLYEFDRLNYTPVHVGNIDEYEAIVPASVAFVDRRESRKLYFAKRHLISGDYSLAEIRMDDLKTNVLAQLPRGRIAVGSLAGVDGVDLFVAHEARDSPGITLHTYNVCLDDAVASNTTTFVEKSEFLDVQDIFLVVLDGIHLAWLDGKHKKICVRNVVDGSVLSAPVHDAALLTDPRGGMAISSKNGRLVAWSGSHVWQYSFTSNEMRIEWEIDLASENFASVPGTVWLTGEL